MPYWIYGTKGNQSADPLYLDAESPASARRLALEMGWSIDSVVYVAPRKTREPESDPVMGFRKSKHLFAIGIIWLFRLLALLVASITTLLVLMQVETIRATEQGPEGWATPATSVLWGAVVVGVLLAIAEGLKLMRAVAVSRRNEKPLESPQRQAA